MDKICRVCLVEKPGMIYLMTLDNTDTELPLFEKIIQCTNVTIARNDNLPQNICTDCKNDLNVAYRFRMNVEGSDFILKKFSLAGGNDDDAFSDTEDVDGREMDDNDNGDNGVSDSTVVEKDSPKSRVVTIQQKVTKEDARPTKPTEVKTIMTIPKLSKEEKLPVIKGITKHTSPDGSVKTMVKISRSNANKGSKRTTSNQSEETHVCHECGKAFSKMAALKAHSKRHLNIKPNVCEICNKSFVLPVELKRHSRVHTGEKPYDCRYCDKKFSDFGTRVKHERIHTQEKPFECHYCGKTFTYSNVLKFHIMVHTGEKKYACTFCPKRFIKAHQLKCHLHTHGVGEPTKRNKNKQQTTTSKNQEIVSGTGPEETQITPNEVQTVQVVSSCDPMQTYMLYLKK